MCEDITKSSPEQVAKMMADCQPGSMQDQKAKAEFYRRQTLAFKGTAKAAGRTVWISILVAGIALISAAAAWFAVLKGGNQARYAISASAGSIAVLDTRTGQVWTRHGVANYYFGTNDGPQLELIKREEPERPTATRAEGTIVLPKGFELEVDSERPTATRAVR